QTSGAFSIREMLGLEEETDPKTGTDSAAVEPGGQAGGDRNWAAPAEGAALGNLSLSGMQSILSNVDVKQRQALLSDETTFRRFVRQEADNLSLLAAAKANNLHSDPNTVFLMQRGAETILRESYLSRLIASKVPADFPKEEQITEYFEKNQGQFVAPERLHVWQIFLPVAENADKAAVDAQVKLAAGIVKNLNEQKTDFAAAALKYSAHEPSRHNGGYMGLVKISDLKPEVSQPLLALPEGKISEPVKTDSGIHILRRGAKVAAEQLSLELVRPKVRELLINQARAQLRTAIYDQARKSYPVEVADKKIEEWRLRLRTNVEPASAGTSSD
ncbi:MAG: peptidylprolyl isomerase, partial [Gammaproteobacteria bacterium]